MKHLSIGLLMVLCLDTIANDGPHRHHFTHVPGTEIVDGTAIKAHDVQQMMSVRNDLQALMHGEKKAGVLTKRHSYKGDPITLLDLIKIFEDLEARGVSHNDPAYQEASQCLSNMIEKIILESEKMLGDHSEFLKKSIITIIHNWAHTRGRHDSLLLNWGKANEKELFRQISANDLAQFCIDLKNFLYDLMFSCPKARNQYKNIIYSEKTCGDKFEEKRAAFDRFFQSHN